MTRQFDVKDEIEVKDDLDKKPDNPVVESSESASLETNSRISRSVERFLAKFKTVDSLNALCNSPNPKFKGEATRWDPIRTVIPNSVFPQMELGQIVVITNLARADLDPLYA